MSHNQLALAIAILILLSFFAPLSLFSQNVDLTNSYAENLEDDDFLDHQAQPDTNNQATLFTRVLIGWQDVTSVAYSLAIIGIFVWPAFSVGQQLLSSKRNVEVPLKRLLLESLYCIASATLLWHLSHILAQPAWGLWTGLSLLIAWIGLHSQVYGDASS